MAVNLLVNSYMTGKSSFARTCDRMFDLQVSGAMIGLALLVIGYYLNEQGPQEGIRGYTGAVLSADMLFGRYLYIASGIFFLISAVSYVRTSVRRNRASFIETGRSLSALEDLSWKEFVDYIIDLYERIGYTLEGASGVRAEGADLKVKREGRFSMVRCKKYYVRKVSLAMVADFYNEICMRPELEKGYFITTGFFSYEARKFAAGKPIDLVDGVRLLDFARIADSAKAAREMSGMQGSHGKSDFACPRCGSYMVLRTIRNSDSSVAEFWGCSAYPACKGALRKEREEMGTSA